MVLFAPARELFNFLGLGYVHLGRDDDLGLFGKVWIMFGKLGIDDVKFFDRIALAGAGNVDQVKQHASALDVPQELNAKSMTEVSAFDQSGNIGDHEGPVHVD